MSSYHSNTARKTVLPALVITEVCDEHDAGAVKVSSVVLGNNELNETSIKGPVGSCTLPGVPHSAETTAPIALDCRNPESCFFCDKYKVHADECDTRKIISCRYCIQRTGPLTSSVEHFEQVFGAILARIEQILDEIGRKAANPIMVEDIRHSVEME